jgi:hypothetical protein
VTERPALERGYRRLLAWYPQPFRAAQEEEILAVLMAGAEQGQHRPRVAEAVDLIRSAVRMRLFPARSGPERRGLADGLAVFSLVAPLFLLAADLLQVVLSYRLPRSPVPLSHVNLESSGAALLRIQLFDTWAGLEVVLAVLVLLGLRRLALLVVIPAMLVYFAVANTWLYWIPDPLVLITAGVLLLEFAALLGSPGPRHGRGLVSWRHGVMLLLAAGSFQAFADWYALTAPLYFRWILHPGAARYLVTGTVLAVAALVLAVVFRLNRYFLLAFAAACYPCAIQLASSLGRGDPLGLLPFRTHLLGNPTPAHLAILFGPPLLFVLGVVFTTAMRAGARAPADPAAPA